MAHVSTDILRGGRSSGSSDGKATAKTVYRVEFDDKNDGAVRARQAPNVPREGQAHPNGGGMVVKSVAADETESPFVFHVTANYEQTEDEEGGAGRSGLPTIRIGSIHDRIIATKTAAGGAIVNSARQPFINPPMYSVSDDTITVSGTVPFDDKLPANVRNYRDSTNSKKLFGYDAYELLLVDRDIRTRRVGGKVMWDVSLTFDAGDHMLRLLDNGLYENGEITQGPRVSEGDPGKGFEVGGIKVGQLKRILDGEGKPMAAPVLLDGMGGMLTDGKPPVELPFKVRFDMNHHQLLNTVGLPTTLDDYAKA